MRERVTVTLRNDLLKQVDRIIDGMTIRSRSQAMEFLLSKVLTDYKLKNVLVLAGGKSRELLPLTKNTPKFLISIKGKTLLEHVLGRLHEFNVGNFLVHLDYMGGKIRQEMLSKQLSFGIDFIEAAKPSGTIEPLLSVRERFRDTFLVAYGDTICSLNINEMLKFHRENKALATIALTTVNNPKKYGVAMLQGNKVTEFIQKPKSEVHSYLINAGYYIFEPEIFKHLERGMTDLDSQLLPKLAEKGLLFGYPFQGLYINVNTRADLEKARLLL